MVLDAGGSESGKGLADGDGIAAAPDEFDRLAALFFVERAAAKRFGV